MGDFWFSSGACRRILVTLLIMAVHFVACKKTEDGNKAVGPGLLFKELAKTWDEAIPLGNGMVGNLIWEKDGKLRFSLDRADLWDLRPMENLDFSNWKFNDVYAHWKNGTYQEVQAVFDVPYDKLPAPSKIPAGALEFTIAELGKVKRVHLELETATCFVEWENGARLIAFVHAQKSLGWYKFENLPAQVNIQLIAPAYNREGNGIASSQSPNDLNELGYEQGHISETEHSITYDQKCWGEMTYQIHTAWENNGDELVGCWSVTSSDPGSERGPSATEMVAANQGAGFDSAYQTHLEWWSNFWSQSEIEIPDSLLLHQYRMEMYKFGSTARPDAPPISLQAVWTADHGKLPPWKGDFHHDLNTQLSYWPAYAGNQLQLEEGYLNWLWDNVPVFKKYTRDYFGVNGLNVPGVTTLKGEPMGGWIQYSMGQTVSAWLAQHFYLHWKFSMDRDFLEKRAYPWLKDVALFLDEISVKTSDGHRKLIISSSPEIHDNSAEAWFAETTNFDLALIRWTYEKAVELALELGHQQEADHWSKLLSEWPELAVDEETGLMIAPGALFQESHRHFSHLMAIHPLGLLDFAKGPNDRNIVINSLNNLSKQGSDNWTGYSFSWEGNMYARARNGEKAAEALRIFATCFCLPNSFHVNGDQCQAGYSNFTYRPFTLEGNFAFASAIQEMLIQSHSGVVSLFPALPAAWKNASFKDLRTYGAFLVSAQLAQGQVVRVKVTANANGLFKLENPFSNKQFNSSRDLLKSQDTLSVLLEKGEEVVLWQ